MLPRILIIDDVFGRIAPDGRNPERDALCAALLLSDGTGDSASQSARLRIDNPIAEAVFMRGQKPVQARAGDIVENDLDSCIARVEGGWHEAATDARIPWALVLVDLCFYTGTVEPASERGTAGVPAGIPENEHPQRYFGLKVLQAIQREVPDAPTVVLSGQPREDVRKSYPALGAVGFIERDNPGASRVLEDLLFRQGLLPDSTGRMLGFSPGILRALRFARRSARSRQHVLIRGETGTGKELLARFINEHGPEASRGKMVALNAAGLSPTLYASELFGHVKGAFTDARTERIGRVQQANGGDLFLDEVGALDTGVQAGILRVLETRTVEPLGGSSGPVPVDVRFLFATNEDIEARAAAGRFREDLLHRIREGGTIYLPPLRDRLEDIPILVEQFVREAEQSIRDSAERDIDPAVLELCQRLPWKGNVRELRSCIFKAVSDFSGVDYLTPNHLELSAPERTTGPVLAIPTPESPAHNSARSLHGALRDELSRTAELFRDALEVTKRVDSRHPDGQISMTRAVQLLVGDHAIKTSKAADIVKRILMFDGKELPVVASDPTLREALDWARRLRPSSRR